MSTNTQFILFTLIIFSSWVLAPALLCEWQLRRLTGWRGGWGLLLGTIGGPFALMAINLYTIRLYLAYPIRPSVPLSSTSLARVRHKETHLRSGPIRLSTTRFLSDLLNLLCIWVIVIAGNTLFTVETGTQADQAGSSSSHTSARSWIKRAVIAATTSPQEQATPVAQSTVAQISASPQKKSINNRDALREDDPAWFNKDSSALHKTADAKTTGPASAGLTAPATSPLNESSSLTPKQSSFAVAQPEMARATTAGKSSAGLAQLIIPSNLKAHSTVSGSGNSTTLTIVCEDCTHAAGSERLSAKSTRETLKAAGIKIVVLVNRQNSWTFIL